MAAGTGDIEVPLPLLPQLLGGDDLWLVARRDVVFGLISTFAAKYQQAVESSPILSEALRIANRELDAGMTESDGRHAGIRLTMSSGIAFAKAGFPAHAMVRAAEDLI